MKLKILLFSLFIFTGCLDHTLESTVKVSNLQATAVASGAIIKSSNGFSEILTNRHVCEVVKFGGLVHTLDGKSHAISGYKESEVHDLCIVQVAEELGNPASISSTPPRLHEIATASGHPDFMPNIVTTGRFSSKEVIRLVTGFRDCTKDDYKDPIKLIFCTFKGKIPLIRTYEAIAVSTLIQPGSSGSAIYGENNKIKAVVFAGSGGISFTYAVPQEYVYFFVKVEAPTLELKRPILELPVGSNGEASEESSTGSSSESKRELINKTVELCEIIGQDNKICKELKSASKWDDKVER